MIAGTCLPPVVTFPAVANGIGIVLAAQLANTSFVFR